MHACVWSGEMHCRTGVGVGTILRQYHREAAMSMPPVYCRFWVSLRKDSGRARASEVAWSALFSGAQRAYLAGVVLNEESYETARISASVAAQRRMPVAKQNLTIIVCTALEFTHPKCADARASRARRGKHM